jgi:tetratricopeptide (TPR) repeat protein
MLAAGEERPELASQPTTKLNFGLCEANLGDVDSSIQWLEAALVGEVEAHGEDHPATLRPLNAICHVQTDRGQTEAAIVACERAIAVARARYRGAQPMLSSLYTNLGSAHFHGGQPGPAETAHLAALDNAMRSQPDDDRLVATIANNLGVLYDSLERVEEAAKHYELAYRRILQGFGPDHPATAMVATNLAMVRVKQGDLDGAVALIEDGMKRIAARLGPEHPDLALSHAELGRIAAKRGDHAAAVRWFRRAYELRNRHGGDDIELADTAWGLAIALADTGAPMGEVAAKAQHAAALYRAAGGQWAERAGQVETWLTGLRRPS